MNGLETALKQETNMKAILTAAAMALLVSMMTVEAGDAQLQCCDYWNEYVQVEERDCYLDWYVPGYDD